MQNVGLEELRQEQLVVRNYRESTAQLLEVLRGLHFDVDPAHEVGAEADLIALIDAGFGFGLFPPSMPTPPSLIRLAVDGLDVSRTVFLYGVAGRQRTPVASTLMKMLRAADWSRYAA